MASSKSHRIVEKYQNYKMERKLKEGYSGGDELRRAMAALAGPKAIQIDRKVSSKPICLPLHLVDPLDNQLSMAKTGHALSVDTLGRTIEVVTLAAGFGAVNQPFERRVRSILSFILLQWPD